MAKKTVPISLVIDGQKALLVGGGQVAAQKLHWLRQLGVPVDLVATSVSDHVRQMAQASGIQLFERPYDGEAVGYALVIGATNDSHVNRAIYETAAAAGVPVNIVDEPALCTFYVPSTVVRGPLKVSVASDGLSPALCARLRREIDGLLPAFYEEYMSMLQAARKRVRTVVSDPERRTQILSELASANTARLLADTHPARRAERWEKLVEQLIEQQALPAGTVYLVGAGPGDRGLFTIKGLQALMGADAVLHDGLANPALMENLSPEVEIHDCSKRAGCTIRTQDHVNELLVELARKGRTVCRLKGGDPCVFGRGGDEAMYLAERNIPFQIVSGVTSAVAVATYAGIPITHRDHASYFQIVTGHEARDKTNSRVNWGNLASGGGTVVFLMGAGRLSEIAAELIEHGRASGTPMAVISRGTLPGQRVFETTLGDAVKARFEETMEFERPALIVVGEVVALRTELDWFHGSADAPRAGGEF